MSRKLASTTMEKNINATEKCIMCQKDTGIPQNIDINDPRRLGCYVEGSGQLCLECYRSST
jgi:hypothetical protein